MIGVSAIAASAAILATTDWLIDSAERRAHAEIRHDGWTLSNGIVTRSWWIRDGGVGCLSLRHEGTGEEFLRSIRPEAIVTIDGTAYPVGGLTGMPAQNFVLPEWQNQLKPMADAFRLVSVETKPIGARVEYKPNVSWRAQPCQWPPKGVDLVATYAGPEGSALADARLRIHTELYDGLPTFGKWFEFVAGKGQVTINAFSAETLAYVEAESLVDAPPHPKQPRLHVETDFTTAAGTMRPTVQWLTDEAYGTQVNYQLKTPCVLDVSPPLGPERIVEPGTTFRSFHTWVSAMDTRDEARTALTLGRIYRTLNPWVTENPLIFHCSQSDDAYVRRAIDQAADAGFEICLMTFGSGFDAENDGAANVSRMKALSDYARSKGIALGGYSLLASRSIDAATDVVNPKTGKPGGFATFGASPCLCSAWGQSYFRKLTKLYDGAGLSVLEHDGSYPGDPCASTTHPGHVGYGDSRWNQWEAISAFYAWCRGKGIYLNVPDWYFWNGSNKMAMGYRETNWSLPRDQQEIIERQNIHDGVQLKTPTMGWMFVPLMEYQGGGAAATLEPLKEHLPQYERRLQNLLGAGVQACYRGPRLFDSPETLAMVQRWTHWYKAHRPILDSDIVPLRRADGRDWDGLLHVNPALDERALAALYNPLDHPIERTLTIPLYYAGLKGMASFSIDGGKSKRTKLDEASNARITVRLPAKGFVWVVFRA